MFTKLIKEITIAAREGGGDPVGNPRLRLAIDNAKAANMPADNIERAVKKATGELEGVIYHELVYEGYGPGGVALMVEVATDNKNRTVADIRHSFSRYGGSLAETGSVTWMFERKGIISLPEQNKTEEDLMNIVLDTGAEDLQLEAGYFSIQTDLESFEPVRKALIAAKLEIENASLQWIAKNNISIKGDDAEKVMKLIEAIEDNDDVQNVFTNADIDEETINQNS
jgi:YebC/PmpR family DNA-binding regulatory protein